MNVICHTHTLPRLAVLGVVLLAAACSSGGSGTGQDPVDPVVGLLKKADSAAELEASLKAGFTTIPDGTNDTLSAGTATGGSPAPLAFSQTYTQEKNVDEFDAVRYDGTHLYIAPRRFYDCCFVLAAAAADGASNTGTPATGSIRILATDPANASATLASEIPLEQGISVQGMYIETDRMFALTAEQFYGTHGEFWTDVAVWAPEKLGYRVYDVADKSMPTLLVDAQIDGVFVESRRIGNTVYIISRYAPQLDGIFYSPQTADQLAQNEAILADVSLDDMLPTITINGVSQPLVDPTNCYVSNDDQMPGYPVITNITAVPIDDPGSFVNTCYDQDAYGAYVSESAVYFPQVVGYLLPDVGTRIHKFALSGTGVTYRGSGDIEGQVWRGGQSDFRMSESDGDLRVLSSKYTFDSTDFVDHLLYVLRESTTAPELEIVGSLPNASRPDPIGKPNEQLYGVRFLADRAYAVTFQQIDPLYVFDLSDPTDPFVAGELEVTGFSDFLHPVTNDLLLGLGSDTSGNVKLELFDVSDLTAPVSRGSASIGTSGAYSEARYDRHAFTYLADVGGVDRLTVPANSFFEEAGVVQFRSELDLFEIRGKMTPDMASLVPVGQIVPPLSSEFAFNSRSRAFLHDDTVYYVLDMDVWSAFWDSPTLVNGPY